ncbi:ferritin [Paraoerskovia marina]|uniref:Ferritin n=1 Tax=Paraoerskovia marina TaxID=545619 RepID=A0A1H1R0A1_9CELL|nr:ferritin [Paraoerskovia marina]SDS29211.1 Ferritin [Paraoerskovia marina]
MSTPENTSRYVTLLREQVGHELDAHQQYVAIAVWFDANDLPQLAAHYYRQALEERNHAMMIVQHMLDRDIPAVIPGTSAVRNDFGSVTEPIALALAQEREVTTQIEAIFRAAREEGDALGEQFMLWFLKEQVEEVASATTLLAVAERAGGNLFDLENFVARETIGDGGESADAPAAAGGAL